MIRLFDIVLSIIALLFFSPLWIAIAIITCLTNRGKIFYIQARRGRNGKYFRVAKFRTIEKGKIVSWFSHILRKTALDEAPQMINILKGDMSFVGPRPLIDKEIEEIKDKDLLAKRLMARPGLTGISQIFIPRTSSVEKKISYDLLYIQNSQLNVYIKFIFLSFLITFLGRWEHTSSYKMIFLDRYIQKIKKKLQQENV